MTLLLTERDVRSLLTMPMALEAVDEAFRGLHDGSATNLPRRRLTMSNGLLHLMSSSVGSRKVFGSKCYATFGGPVDFLIPLYNLEDGKLLALIESDWLGRIRTGAASGVATKYMARPESRTLGLVGTGGQARTQLLAVCTAMPGIQKAHVFSRSADKRAEFIAEMQPQVHAEIVPVAEARAAVEGMDVVTTMTSAREPVFQGEWLAPGTHVNAAGANSAKRREIDLETVRRCSRIAADSVEQARMECGDLIAAVEAGVLEWDNVIEFADIAGGDVPGRASARECTLFESQGISVWDIATAARVYELAQAQGLGQSIPLFESGGG
jgi:ornithine cyclodeaminase/alanine dehydrogenase-like protein (mu-crystallin family)